MRILITAGPTREPIDAVRYLGNRSSGRMGIALASAAQATGHTVTLILGPVALAAPEGCRILRIETAQQMHDAVLAEFTNHDLLIMAAAVADYRPVKTQPGKIGREGKLLLELEATPDILAAASLGKRPDQRTVGFSLEERGNLDRARRKLHEKHLDLIVYNPIDTLDSPAIQATLLWPDGRSEQLSSRAKEEFADILLQRCIALMDR
jgi:phosphopantothenoylcysteine decarboxylase/phosphopantothenate--cysteine ligase